MTTGRGLTAAERESLERDGYLLVPSVLDDSTVDQLRARVGALVAQEVAEGHADYGNPPRASRPAALPLAPAQQTLSAARVDPDAFRGADQGRDRG